ncbi:ATP-binding cassette domain-containing protein [Micromonospora tulbaghiae]|uniref:ATP-binding cassette domain-containing protein n=1 Tax=Micromonospora tulbaghiae TaxID=479978 RepID=A0AAW4JB21_9ACTN|nr:MULTISPECIES: ATP-binding cassette domain-containing protein [Micromonospora]KAB1910136.1 ATP-binding cassette domain-containing protein [Micromonospora sp. AMSO1212t]MBO4138575.1 ATP-binding cassette domain-containing protein [Micromonospora tulbaghiae]
MDLTIEAEGLRKSYGTHTALAGVDLAVPAGTVLGLLGPNGAGKTTMVRILSTLLTPDGGSARVCGYDVVRKPREVRRRVGLTGQYAAVDELLTGRENLVLIGVLHHLGRRAARTRADELLERFQLTDAAERAARTYSGGMRRRLDLAASLVADPPVLVLDEPTTGLDVTNRRTLWAMVREQVAKGTTVLLTTQYLEEADHLAGRILVLDGGKVIAEGTSDELKRKVGDEHLQIRVREAAQRAAAVAALTAVTTHRPVLDDDGVSLRLPMGDGLTGLAAAASALDAARVDVESFASCAPTLDDVFLNLTGRSSAEQPEAAA